MAKPSSRHHIAVNLSGSVEHPAFSDGPYRIDREGHSIIPVGNGGIVLGLRLGESVFARDADHAAPGACLIHADQAARNALTAYSCVGNQATVRTGRAAGARGVVIGKRGEAGRVIVSFQQGDLAQLRPGDEVVVRAYGQGYRPEGYPGQVTVLNIDPAALAALPIAIAEPGDALTVGVRLAVPSKRAGNGIGRPAAAWDLDLQLCPGDVAQPGGLLLGDLVAVFDLDARWNMGYRRGWLTVGIIGHAASPLPGHGPGMTPILTGPAHAIRAEPSGAAHAGLTEAVIQLLTATG
jgi:hypothetical protein